MNTSQRGRQATTLQQGPGEKVAYETKNRGNTFLVDSGSKVSIVTLAKVSLLYKQLFSLGMPLLVRQKPV
jgi:hypothetical protein